MDIKIAVQHVNHAIELDAVGKQEEIVDQIKAALTDGGMLSLRDTKGRDYLIPAATIGWIQVGDGEHGKVGFGRSDS